MGIHVRSHPLVLCTTLSLLAPALTAQSPVVATVDFYGLRQVSDSVARTALGIAPGDTLTALKMAVATARLGSVPGVVHARLAPVCCTDGRTMLYVGVEEEGAPTLRFRAAPTDTVPLPAPVIQAGDAFAVAFDSALAHQDFAEDDSAGHQLMPDACARCCTGRPTRTHGRSPCRSWPTPPTSAVSSAISSTA
jgi:hypothetical protein